MRILITGGAGFIGSHLAERALREGWKVSIIDDLSTGAVENIVHLKQNPDFSSSFDTVFNTQLLAELVDYSDVVFHLAAAVGVRLVVESPVRTIETNVHGTEVVLQAVAKKKKPIFIASTSEVYGKSSALPFSEDGDLVLGPTTKGRWSYACSKALDEYLGMAYWNEKKVPVTVVRFFNTVGPRQSGRYGMVLPTFVAQALQNEPLTVFGSGEQQRCFTYVGDTVEALVRLARSSVVAGQVINLGSDQEISIFELAGRVKAITGSKSAVQFLSYDVAYAPGFEDMMRRVPSINKLQHLIDYRPSTDIDAIIRQVAEFWRSRCLDEASCAPHWSRAAYSAAGSRRTVSFSTAG